MPTNIFIILIKLAQAGLIIVLASPLIAGTNSRMLASR